MKTELTARDLIPFIGSIEVETDKNSKTIPVIKGHLSGLNRHNHFIIGEIGDSGFCLREASRITTICRPFSHLTTEIEVNGERFVPVEVLAKYLYQDCGFLPNDSVIIHNNLIRFYAFGNTNEVPIAEISFGDGEMRYDGPYKAARKIIEWGFPIGLPAGTWKEVGA